MNAGGWVTVWLVIAAGAGIGCLASYFRGRFNGYIDGYAAGQAAEQQSAAREMSAVKAHVQATQSAIGYLYEQAQAEVEQLGSNPTPPYGSERP